MPKKLLIILFISVVVIWYTNSAKSRRYVPEGISIDKITYPVTGIDLSHHSGKIDFKKIKGDNIDFVYSKATEGIDLKDDSFEKNYELALENKVRIGFYHFYRFDESPKEQAEFFLSAIDDKKYEMPLVIDVEEWGNETDKSRKEIRQDISEFIEYVEGQTKREMVIYTNLSSHRTYISGLSDNKVWICAFRKEEILEGEWLFWQHSHKGKRDYVEGWVDLNTFNGTREEFDLYLDNYWKQGNE